MLLQVGHGIPQRTPANDLTIIHSFDAGGPIAVVLTVVVVQTVRPLHSRATRGSLEDIVHFTTISEGLDTSAQATSTTADVPDVAVVVAVVVQIGH